MRGFFLTATIIFMLSVRTLGSRLSAALSPDKKLCIGITSYGEADLYSLDKQTFLAKVVHSLGPFRSLSTAIFYDWRSVALASRDSATVNTIPSLRAMSESECKTFRLNGDASLVPIHSLVRICLISVLSVSISDIFPSGWCFDRRKWANNISSGSK